MRLRLEQTTDNQRLCPSGNEQRSDKRGSLSHGERSLTKEQYAEEERYIVLLLATFVAKPALSPSHRKSRVESRRPRTDKRRNRPALPARLPPVAAAESSHTILNFSSMIFWRGCESLPSYFSRLPENKWIVAGDAHALKS